MKSRKTSASAESGFTLIELVIVIVIVGIIAAMVVTALLQSADSFNFFTFSHGSSEDVAAVSNLMIRNIKEIASRYDVLVANDTLLKYVNIENDTISLLYSAAGDSLLIQKNSGRWGIAGDISQFDFDYLREDGTTATPLLAPLETDIWTIRFSLTVTNPENSIDFRTKVYPRF